MKVFIDDLIRVLADMHNSGFHYCDIDLIEEEPSDDEDMYLPAMVMLQGLDCGGKLSVNFDEPEIEEVEDSEISNYAHKFKSCAPSRKSIKKLTIEDF